MDNKSPFLRRTNKRRQIDFEIMTDWIEPNSRVLDLGCGRGVFLRELMNRKNVYGIGVDSDSAKVASCIRRGVNVFQGDIGETLTRFEPGFFDYVILSRTLELVDEPGAVIRKACEIGKNVLVGTINRGYWKNRWTFFRDGKGARNDVYPLYWEDSPLSNHVSLSEFLTFCKRSNLIINHSHFLRGDWRTECTKGFSWLAGYGIFNISAPSSSPQGRDEGQP